ncbi:MAG: glycoside hydrolase family 27 protein [Bacteroidales bacterium]|nr:glycoside hydrolase family 27 protein [Bacteroidales bacterium]
MKIPAKLLLATVLACVCACQPRDVRPTESFGDFRDWALTPPMGWNSWDCYGPTVVESEVKANADYMAAHLKDAGWEYIVVDIRWFVENDKAGGYNQTDPRYVMDEWGRYQPAVNRFPSAADGAGFKPLADYIHGKGLKFGIHIMRGIPRIAVQARTPVKGTDGITADRIYNEDRLCRWLRDNYSVDATRPGAQQYYDSLFELYASWGVDYIKIDDLSSPYHKEEIEMIRRAIDGCGRPIVLSTSPGPTPPSEAAHISTHANLWRMVNDVWDLWSDVTNLMRVAQDWYPYIQSGTWPDCDMIPLGRLSIRGERGGDRPSRLSPDEQRSLMTFFCILRSPLMFGGDLPSLDPFTESLLTNDEVLRMHRESDKVRQIFRDDDRIAVTSVNPGTGETYLALFNLGGQDATVSVPLSEMGLKGRKKLTELWTGESSRSGRDSISAELAPHACALYKINR